MSRALFRAALELRGPSVRLSARAQPLIPSRSFIGTNPNVDPYPQPPPKHPNNAPNPTDQLVRPFAFKKSHPAEPPKPADNSVKNLLPLLAAQPGHYITVHIHGFPYLVQHGDEIRLPFKMPGVLPGDVLRLNRASVLGSRDYTMKGAPTIDERAFECRATVLGTESEPMRIKVKKKRRQRRKRTVMSKHRYTMLRISQLDIMNIDELERPLGLE